LWDDHPRPGGCQRTVRAISRGLKNCAMKTIVPQKVQINSKASVRRGCPSGSEEGSSAQDLHSESGEKYETTIFRHSKIRDPQPSMPHQQAWPNRARSEGHHWMFRNQATEA
jgi:hypothetical protein